MRRHQIRWPALIFGLLFTSLIATRLLWQLELSHVSIIDKHTVGVSGAIVLIALGAIGIFVTVVRDRRHAARKNKGVKTKEHDDKTPET